MPTYRTIAASETDSESPITQELMDALRLNLPAAFEGAPGAPRVEPPALDIVLANGTADEGDSSPLTLCQALTGVDGLNFIMFGGRIAMRPGNNPGDEQTVTVLIQRSTNGGSTWESAIEVFDKTLGESDADENFTYCTPFVATGFDAARIRVEFSNAGVGTFDVSGFIIGLGV